MPSNAWHSSEQGSIEV